MFESVDMHGFEIEDKSSLGNITETSKVRITGHFVKGLLWAVDSFHKGPVIRKKFQDVIMLQENDPLFKAID